MFLSKHPGCVNEAAGSGRTPLHTALINQHYDIAWLLIQQGADIEMPTGRYKTTVLEYAVGRLDDTALALLIRGGADPDTTAGWLKADGGSVVAWGARHGMGGLLRALIEKGSTIEKEVLRICQLPPMKPPKISVGTLFQMLEETLPDSMSRISNSTMLFLLAAGKLDLSLIDILIRHGADVNHAVDGQTLLMLAVEPHRNYKFEDAKVVARLVECGAQTNTKGRNDWTALHMAVSISPFGLPSCFIVQTLLRRGADWGAKTEAGETPLDIAKANRGDVHGWLDFIITCLEAKCVAV